MCPVTTCRTRGTTALVEENSIVSDHRVSPLPGMAWLGCRHLAVLDEIFLSLFCMLPSIFCSKEGGADRLLYSDFWNANILAAPAMPLFPSISSACPWKNQQKVDVMASTATNASYPLTFDHCPLLFESRLSLA